MNLEAGERVSNSMSVFPGTLVVNGISQFETSQVCIGALRPHGGVTWCFGFASAYIRCRCRRTQSFWSPDHTAVPPAVSVRVI
ncbi:putative 1-phosphatidylinositol 4-kinase [Toxoplasma gondii MAS]|uniref:Putative 1-phosphatidylinositol 4-kinase n=2 Tax=Toxoplasma gondii TaxID=5811 RepID=A0A086PZW2_TOXGO|nr:putative 1-phosphatidylinositol 4-kinase [Toxoplasma gondii p89]KFH05894.1 putative 1-phosphatidylinositol 4-kinase [Toxoplasma gondii MAS]